MSKSKAIGSKYFRVGSQNQQILAKYWGTGKTFTTEDLSDSLDVSENSSVSDVLFIYENYPYDNLETNSFKSKLLSQSSISNKNTKNNYLLSC